MHEPDEVGERVAAIGRRAQVLVDGHALEQLEALERTAEAGTRRGGAATTCSRRAVELHTSARVDESRDRVDQRGLARAVRPDEPDHLARGAASPTRRRRAWTPPNRTDTLVHVEGHRRDRARRSASRRHDRRTVDARRAACGAMSRLGTAQAGEPVRLRDEHDDQQDAERDLDRLVVVEEVAATASVTRLPGATSTADERAGDEADAADHRVDHHEDRLEDRERRDRRRRSVAGSAMSDAADRGDAGGEAERVELGAEHADAERGGGALVGAHRDQPAAGAAPAQVRDEQREQANARNAKQRVPLRVARTASTSMPKIDGVPTSVPRKPPLRTGWFRICDSITSARPSVADREVHPARAQRGESDEHARPGSRRARRRAARARTGTSRRRRAWPRSTRPCPASAVLRERELARVARHHHERERDHRDGRGRRQRVQQVVA